MQHKFNTYSGKIFDLECPMADMIDLKTIAHCLAMIPRFNGHTWEHYSVAEHSIMASRICLLEHAKAALLHDAAEAYIGDIIGPLKRMPEIRGFFSLLQQKILRVIGHHFEIALDPLPFSVKDADRVLLMSEIAYFYPNCPKELYEPELAMKIWKPYNWDARTAEVMFLERAEELGIE